jgi:hypothetical protein
MNRKGASFLIFGMFFVVFMGFLSMFVFIGTEFVRFESYAGRDANLLSQMQYDSYHNIFYFETVARAVLPEIISNHEEYFKFLIDNLELKQEGNAYIIRNETVDYFRDIQSYRNIQEWSTKEFNNKVQTTRTWNDLEIPTYQLYLEEKRITGISETQKNITSDNGVYYYWPHVVVYTEEYANLNEKIQIMIDTFIEIEREQPEQEYFLPEDELERELALWDNPYESENEVIIYSENKFNVIYLILEKELLYSIGNIKLKAKLDQENDTSNTNAEESPN